MAQIKVGTGLEAPKGIHTFRGGTWQLSKSVNVFRNGVLNRVWSATLPEIYPNVINTASPLVHMPEAFDADPVQILDETSEYYLIKSVNWSLIGFDINVNHDDLYDYGGHYTYRIPVEIISSTFPDPEMTAYIYQNGFYDSNRGTRVGGSVSKRIILGSGLWWELHQLHIMSVDTFNDEVGEIVFKLYKSADFSLTLMNYINYTSSEEVDGSVDFHELWEDNGTHIQVQTDGPNNGIRFPLENMIAGASYTFHLESEIVSVSPNLQQKIRFSLYDEDLGVDIKSDLVTSTSQVGTKQSYTVDFTIPHTFNNNHSNVLRVKELAGGTTVWKLYLEGTKIVHKQT